MRNLLVRAAAGVLLTLSQAGHGATPVAEGQPMPSIRIPKSDGGALDQATLKGKVTVINFWATWCEACKVELVEMEDQFRPYASEKDLQLAFVTLDKEPEKAKEWVRSSLKEPDQFLSRLYLDGAFETAESLSVDAFPMTFVVDRDGKVVKVQRGFKPGEGSTESIVKTVGQMLK